MTYEAKNQTYRTFIVSIREFGTVTDSLIAIDNAMRVMNDGEDVDGYIASITETYDEVTDMRQFDVIVGMY